LYKEDFEKFRDGLLDVIEKIDEMNTGNYNPPSEDDFSFDDL
jgi:hypothetical protein